MLVLDEADEMLNKGMSNNYVRLVRYLYKMIKLKIVINNISDVFL